MGIVLPGSGFTSQLASAVSNKIWFTPEFHKRTKALCNHIVDCLGDEESYDTMQFAQIGLDRFAEVDKLKQAVFNQFFLDIKELDDISKFQKQSLHW